MRPVVPAGQQVREQVGGERVEGTLQPYFGHPRGLRVKLLLAEPRVRHVLLHVVVVFVVLVVALRPGPEGHQQGGVAQVPADRVNPRVVAERCVAAVVSCKKAIFLRLENSIGRYLKTNVLIFRHPHLFMANVWKFISTADVIQVPVVDTEGCAS